MQDELDHIAFIKVRTRALLLDLTKESFYNLLLSISNYYITYNRFDSLYYDFINNCFNQLYLQRIYIYNSSTGKTSQSCSGNLYLRDIGQNRVPVENLHTPWSAVWAFSCLWSMLLCPLTSRQGVTVRWKPPTKSPYLRLPHHPGGQAQIGNIRVLYKYLKLKSKIFVYKE